MGIRFNAGRIAAHGMLAAGLFVGAHATANAQSASTLSAPAKSEVRVTLKGVVSVTDLAASQANFEALQNQRKASPVQKPVHRLPDGSLTSAPSRATRDALPTDAGTDCGCPQTHCGNPGFRQRQGFHRYP
jgi:hypothetical protein